MPCSAVPVLDAICTPGIAPFCCATFSAPTISSVSLAATCGDTARRCWYPTVVEILARSGPLRLPTR
ncbi:Uncharacterised protein [Mycobacterium tuberculosis]|nr:Uncharacterised protein [Mycobacterium tuberculosis]